MTSNPVALVVGASRGIGRQVAIDLARHGYCVAVAAKSSSDASKTTPFPPDPNSAQSTVDTVEREITEAGGRAMATTVDVRDFGDIERMVKKVVHAYGHLDVLVYNSGAVWWAEVERTPMKRFQLMQRVNPEGLYGSVQTCMPHFERNGWRGRIIVVSPPIYSCFFRGQNCICNGQGRSVLTKGLAMDFERQGRHEMSVTSIWPAAAIDSAATKDPTIRNELRKPTIFPEAVLAILKAPVASVNGNLGLDEEFLSEFCGVKDFSEYALVPGSSPRRIMPAAFPSLEVKE
ncbi:short chain dehydrogenase [Delphinella strobiligena]|nr:short chain dehydrogenase [Delphinella strobiligena]